MSGIPAQSLAGEAAGFPGSDGLAQAFAEIPPVPVLVGFEPPGGVRINFPKSPEPAKPLHRLWRLYQNSGGWGVEAGMTIGEKDADHFSHIDNALFGAGRAVELNYKGFPPGETTPLPGLRKSHI